MQEANLLADVVSTFLQTWVVATETVPEIVATSSPVICSPEDL